MLRLWRATVNTRNGLAFAIRSEQAVREELFALALSLAMAVFSTVLPTWLIAEAIRRRDSRFQKFAYTTAKNILHAPFPNIPIVHWLLAMERRFRKGGLRHLISKIYYAPLLRREAHSVGKALVLYEDIPKVFGKINSHRAMKC